MPHQLWITAFLNKYFAGVANAILGVFHLQAAHPQAPIPNYVAMQIVVFVLLVLVFVLVRMSLSVEHPNPLQHTFEGIYAMIDQQGQEVIARSGRPSVTPRGTVGDRATTVVGRRGLFCVE